MIFVQRRGRCLFPLLHLVAVSRFGLTPPRLRPPLGLTIAFTLGVDAVVSEVADRAAALHRRSKPLSAILPRKIRRYAVVVQPLFAAPLPVNQSFSFGGRCGRGV